ncbi:MAG: hypothetical protein OEY44_02515 [Candidatus Peregrinibacteria bacterium]|nr:hypothetical protein [Candidatus Peregrinibacteria bacterium]
MRLIQGGAMRVEQDMEVNEEVEQGMAVIYLTRERRAIYELIPAFLEAKGVSNAQLVDLESGRVMIKASTSTAAIRAALRALNFTVMM